jgi:hypothetical protein
MLITKEVKIKWNPKNKKFYEEKGYEFSKYNDEFLCSVHDLANGSHVKVEIYCDYCMDKGIDTFVTKEWRNYVRDNINSVVHTDCCAKCQPVKTKECNLINYGVESKTSLQDVQQKLKDSHFKEYGVDHPMKNKDIYQKAINTFINNYGFENPMQHPDVIRKSNDAKIKRFGSTNHLSDPDVVQKYKDTCLGKYGCEWHLQSPEVRAKSRVTMYENGTVACSKQQKYLHYLFGGELNYPFNYYNLDIAFPKEKIYIEYNGNGHNLSVKLGGVTEKEFNAKEIKRYKYLKYQGWKVININSPYDYLPTKEILLEEFNKAIEWLSVDGFNHSHYNVDIGTLVNDPKYGRVKKLKDSDFDIFKEVV